MTLLAPPLAIRSNRTAGSWSYDSGDSQLLSLRTTSCSSGQGQGFTYNADGDRLSSTDLATSTTLRSMTYSQGTTSAAYSYDGDGLRASKTVNGTSEAFTWDLAESIPLIIQDGNTRYLTGPDGLPIEQIDGSGQVVYYLQDQLGSTRGLIDSTGAIVGIVIVSWRVNTRVTIAERG